MSEQQPAAQREWTFRRIRRYRQVLIGAPLVALLVLAAVAAPFLVAHEPNTLNPRAKAQPPSLTHVLGTDEFGRDLWSRLLYGGRITLLVAFASVILSVIGGTLLGTVA